MQYSVAPIRELHESALRALLVASEEEGFRFVRRVAREWGSGTNRFSRPGEVLFGAFVDARLVGVCGLMVDPYANQPEVARLRNLYVLPEARRAGIGEALANAVISAAAGAFRLLRLRSASPEASRLYERLGFIRSTSEPDTTHLMPLQQTERVNVR